MDSLENTHPVAAKIDDPKEIADIFDPITYGKVRLHVTYDKVTRPCHVDHVTCLGPTHSDRVEKRTAHVIPRPKIRGLIKQHLNNIR